MKILFRLCLLSLLVGTGEGARKLNVLTYNVWLQETIAEAKDTKDARRTRIIDALKTSTADAMCLQEVYLGEDVQAIVDGLSGVFPYSFSAIHSDVNTYLPKTTDRVCGFAEYTNLHVCLVLNGCSNFLADPEALNTCLLTNCRVQFLAFFNTDSQDCLTCLYASILNFERCTTSQPDLNVRQINNGGLLVLSRQRLSDATYNDYYPNTVESFGRGYIQATVGNTASLFCTHLTDAKAILDFFEPELVNLGISSYLDKQTHEADSLVSTIQNNRGGSVLLGDFNSGLAFRSGLNAESPETYKKLRSAMKTKPVKSCTLCDVTDGSKSAVIDHIFVKRMSMRKPKRVYVPKPGKELMSIHAGVMSVVKKKKSKK